MAEKPKAKLIGDREQLLICLAGPTASGKSTVCKKLLPLVEGLKLSVSTTTRSPRAGELDGKDYFFVDASEFQKRVDSDQFIEHAEFSGNRYGTEKRNIDIALGEGMDLLFEIEIQGVQQLKNLYGKDIVTIFIFPVSFETMEQRLLERGTETPEQIQLRLRTAREEVKVLSDPAFTDYIVINDELEHAIADVRAIISAERSRLDRRTKAGIAKLLK